MLNGQVLDVLVFVFGQVHGGLFFLIGPVNNPFSGLLVLFPNLKLLVPTLGTIGSHCKDLQILTWVEFFFLFLKPPATLLEPPIPTGV